MMTVTDDDSSMLFLSFGGQRLTQVWIHFPFGGILTDISSKHLIAGITLALAHPVFLP